MPVFVTNLAIPTANGATPADSLCPGDLPLVLLPVRLETRFFPQAGGNTELRVRVFPDKIHLDSHEQQLTPDEHTWGKHYWEQDWRAGDDAAKRADAWRQLADRFGAPRAAWIGRVLQPSNARPTTPTAEGGPLAVPPEFPTITPANSNDSWRHPPQARLLPDRWVAIVHSAGRVAVTATGNTIQRPLNVGPDPGAPAPTVSGEQLAIDDGMKWMVDFDTAESKGMALRISIPAAVLAAGLDSLLVFGVVRSLTVAETANQLADLLDAHHYTSGLSFVRLGTPTNNTDDRRAGYNSSDPGHAASFVREVLQKPVAAASNAYRVGTALGLPFPRIAPVFDHIEHSVSQDETDMRSMNTALWSAGWGYFLSNMAIEDPRLTPERIDWARRHFIDHVRAFGPFPAMRCGAQPYGILPVTSLDLWQAGGANETGAVEQTWLKGLLRTARDGIWRAGLPAVARIGNRQSPPDPDADLADVMRTDAVSSSYGARNVFGTHYLQHLYHRVGQGMTASNPAQFSLVAQLGISRTVRLTRLWYADFQRNINAPLVQAGEVSPWAPLAPNYIDQLLATPLIKDIVALPAIWTADGAKPSLLQTLLRHALLREIAFAAASMQASATGADLRTLLRDVELVDLVTGAPPTDHWLRQLDKKLATTGDKTIRQHLEALTTFTQPTVAALGEFRASLAHLKGLDSEALQLLMQGTLDLSAHRLDAWVTSFATRRLAAMDIDGPAGQYIGAYGWVENLKPIAAGLTMPVSPLPAGEPGPLQTQAKDSGFIHAPSLSHAATAALLRNSQLGPTGVPTANGPFAIDLSSRRVREALRLLEGVRQGQPLGALLGYRVERLLHDTVVDNGLHLDRFIAPLRRLAPLVARANESNTSMPVEAIAANNVVDGLVLARRWKEQRPVIDATIMAMQPSTGEAMAVWRILDGLIDSIDGLSDALTAETAYQVARGNTARVAGTLQSIAAGDAPPPDLEVTRTPRSGIALTHRVMLLMSGTSNLNTPGWLAGDAGMRSRADRLLNFWAAKALGDASKVRCTIERLDDAGAVVETRSISLNALGLVPLDVVYGVEAVNNATQAGTALSEIEQMVLYFVKRMAGGFDPDASLRIQHARPANLAAGEMTLFDLLEQARDVRRLLSVSRGARPEDLNPPERIAGGTIDLVELENRVVHAENAINAAHKALNLLVTRPATATAELLRAAMMKLGVFGVGPAIPVSVAGEDPAAIAALMKQSQALLKVSGARLEQFIALRAAPAATEQQARCSQLIARMQAVFGSSFVVLPRFTFDSAAATEFSSALASSTQAQGGDPLAVNTWFTRCSRVRDSVGRMGSCLQRAEILGANARLNLSVAQLPFSSGQRWVALPGGAPLPGKLSLVLHTVGPVNPAQVLTGLLVDEWVEVVPSTEETTAIAFQFDVPDAVAPQSLLIAVPPVPGQAWSTESLRQTLMETLDLAKLRAVDTSALGPSAQMLPGLFMAMNTRNHAVSTDFKPLVA